MSKYEVCGYAVLYKDAVMNLCRSRQNAEDLARIIDGSEVVPVYREIKQEKASHE